MKTVFRRIGTITLALLAALVGLGGYAFYYAKGYSYLSNDPSACANCHVMREYHASWQVSSHRSLTCNDCHLPHEFPGKYWSKIKHGFNHSAAFTFGDVQIIRLKEGSAAEIESNCIRCHWTTVSSVPHGDDGKRCFECHRGVGHSVTAQ